MKKGYLQFLTLAQDLDEAKKEIVKTQYYTGTNFMAEEYKKIALEFNKLVLEYLDKIKELIK